MFTTTLADVGSKMVRHILGTCDTGYHRDIILLIREHLGVSSDDVYCDVTDPVDVDFYKNVWLKRASINTTVYDKV